MTPRVKNRKIPGDLDNGGRVDSLESSRTRGILGEGERQNGEEKEGNQRRGH